ncbi:MAG: hypothetical protein ACPF8V_03890 [Luteibaculum sp.]
MLIVVLSLAFLLLPFILLSQRTENSKLPSKYYWELCYLQKESKLTTAEEEDLMLKLQKISPLEFEVLNHQAILIEPGLCAIAFHSKEEKIEFQQLKAQLSMAELRRNFSIIDKRIPKITK